MEAKHPGTIATSVDTPHGRSSITVSLESVFISHSSWSSSVCNLLTVSLHLLATAHLFNCVERERDFFFVLDAVCKLSYLLSYYLSDYWAATTPDCISIRAVRIEFLIDDSSTRPIPEVPINYRMVQHKRITGYSI